MWHYSPSIPASVIFFVLFLSVTSYHAYLLTRRKTWFCIPFVVGGAFEFLGYILRAVAHSNQQSVPVYAMQYLFLLLAPILFAASIYMILGRIIRLTKGDEYSVVRVNWLTRLFVGSDVLCFLIQMGGGGMLAAAKTKERIDLCNHIVLGGLILQILMFMFFVTAAVIFHSRMKKRPTSAAIDGPLGMNSRVGAWGKWTLGRSMPGWMRMMYFLYITSVLITLRNLFRVVEYGMGWSSYLLNNEWVLLVFDGLLMFGVLVICIVCYDPEISKGKRMKYAKQVDRESLVTEEGNVVKAGSEMRPLHNGHGNGPWS